jgi:hypothetical protein
MEHQKQIAKEELEGLFKRDAWTKMKYAERDAFYKKILTEGCIAILNGTTNDLEDYVKKEILETGIYSKDWSRFCRTNPSISGNIYDAQDELVNALNLLDLARHNPPQALDRLSSKEDWKFVSKTQVLQKIKSLMPNREANEKTNVGKAAIPEINGLVNWAKNHLLAVGGIGLAGYLFYRKQHK